MSLFQAPHWRPGLEILRPSAELIYSSWSFCSVSAETVTLATHVKGTSPLVASNLIIAI